MTRVFFRDDDVGLLTQGLENVVELLIEEQVPCSYQVVPMFLNFAGANYMMDAHKEFRSGVILNQHGMHHEQVINGKTHNSEFAGRRTYVEQSLVIENGRAMLREMIGTCLDASTFTPPCHKYDATTIRALDELGFKILSAGVKVGSAASLYYSTGRAFNRVSLLGKRVSYHERSVPRSQLVEVSVCIDVDEDVDGKGNKITKSVEDLWREFEICRAELPTVGVMLHHQKCSGERVDTLREFVHRLKADPDVEFRTLQDLAAEAL